MADSSADSRKPSSISARLAATLHWRRLVRLPLHLPRLALRVLWVAFFVLAVGFLLLRHVAAPQIAQQRERIEQAISQELGLKVRITALEGDWNGLRPHLAIHGLRVFDKEDRVALELPEVDVSVGLSSILTRRLTLYRLEIVRPELAIRRKADGSVFMAGLQINSGGQGGSGFGDFVLEQRQILIRDARLVWTDEQRDAPELALDRVNLRVENFGHSHRFALLASPPAAYSANLDIRGDLHGAGFERLDDWRGTFYLSLDEADLAVWQKWLDYPLALPRGRGGLRTWIHFNGKHLEGLTADVALADVSMRFAKDLPMLDLASLQGRVNLEADTEQVNFEAQNLSLATREGLHIGPTRMGFHYTLAKGNTPGSGSFTSGALDVRVLAQLAAYLPLPEESARRLAQAEPSGRIVDVKLDWQAGAAERVAHFNVAAQLEDLHLKPAGDIPGADGLSVRINGSERSGEFRFAMANGMLHLPGLLRESDVTVNRLDVAGRWEHAKPKNGKQEFLTVRLDKGQLANPYLPNAEVSGYWQARASGPGYLEVHAQTRRAALDEAWRFIPATTAEFVPQWMRGAIKGGRAEDVRLQFAGDLSHFTGMTGPGIFRIDARLADVKFDTFAVGWPGTTGTQGTFLLDRQRMTVHLDKGFYQGVVASDSTIEIPDLMDAGKQVLTVDARFKGPTTDFLAYVNASHVGEISGSFTREMRAQGNGELNLHLDVPLHDSRNTRVKGEYRFISNTMKLVSSLPDFVDTNGILGFTEHGLTLSGTEATFLGRRLRASGVTEPDGTLRLDAQGPVTVAGLRKLAPNRAWDHLQGEAAATVSVRVRKAVTEVSVDSNFVGISSDLPQPLGKDATERWPVRFGLRIEGRESSSEGALRNWRVRADAKLDVIWVEQCRESRCTFMRGAVASGEDAVAAARGWRFSGEFKTLDAGLWRPVVDELLADDAESAPAAQATATTTVQSGQGSSGDVVVAIKTAELIVDGLRFRDVTVKSLRRDGNWTAHFEGPDLTGDLEWRDAGNGSLRARLTRLSLQPVATATASPAASAPARDGGRPARQPPAVDIVADRFRLRNMELGRLALLAASDDGSWLLKNVSLTAPDMEVTGSGSWRGAEGTQIDFRLLSDNAGTMLGRFGASHTVNKGRVEFGGNLAWRGLPTTIDYATLNGKLSLKAAGGQFTEMEPGATGRLLGILSLQSLPRRLMGNFDDVIAKGFAFDSITGDLHVESGVLYANNMLEVQGPSARIFITGSTDLAHEEHNLKMRVQPTMSETVAVGVLAGQVAVGVVNPVVGIGVYFGQKLLRDPVEKIFSYDLEVTGPWSDPRVVKKTEHAIEAHEEEPGASGASAPESGAASQPQ